jgi:hypothetical protein
MATERGLDLAARLWNWRPHSQGQRDWLLCDAKIKTAACGRRWGKSESTGVDIVLYALEHPNSTQFIVAPTDDQTKIIMEQASRFLHSVPALSAEIREVRSPYWNLFLLDSKGLRAGTAIKARTAGPTGKGLRGNKAHRVILDEAAYIPDSILDAVIGPLLADYDGDLVKISTPVGMNHFHRDFAKGNDPHQPRYASFQFPTSTNPFISRDYLENERQNRPERAFQQEYEAQFLEEAGGVFRGVKDVVSALLPKVGKVDTLGVDLARTQDFTVLTGFDSEGRQGYFERFNQISWERQIERIKAAWHELGHPKILLDSTGVGDPIFERLRKELPGAKIEGVSLTNSSKESLIDNLAMLIEQARIALQDIPEQTAELLAYQYELTPSRNVRMNAPEGMHDDTVIALALAAWPLKQKPDARKVVYDAESIGL